MDYDPEPPEPLDKPAQQRVVDAVLITGFITAGMMALDGLVLMFAPGPLAPPLWWGLVGAVVLAGAVHLTFQFHYVIRFMFGRGEWVTHRSPDWGDHDAYLTSQLYVWAAIGVVGLLLAGLNTFVN